MEEGALAQRVQDFKPVREGDRIADDPRGEGGGGGRQDKGTKRGQMNVHVLKPTVCQTVS